MASPPPACPHGTSYAQPCYGCGWACPTCGRNYAPWVRECNYSHEKTSVPGDAQPRTFTDGAFGPMTPIKPVPADEAVRAEPIFVPLRAGADVTPARMADIAHMLRYVAPDVVAGDFVVLPPGSKVAGHDPA